MRNTLMDYHKSLQTVLSGIGLTRCLRLVLRSMSAARIFLKVVIHLHLSNQSFSKAGGFVIRLVKRKPKD